MKKRAMMDRMNKKGTRQKKVMIMEILSLLEKSTKFSIYLHLALAMKLFFQLASTKFKNHVHEKMTSRIRCQ